MLFCSNSDTQSPVLTCPGDRSVANDQGLNTAVVTWSAITVVDNSGESLVAFSDHPSGSAFPLGLTTVLYSATDASGNTGTCRFGVTVQGEFYILETNNNNYNN